MLQYSRYNIHATIFTLHYSHYNIHATIFMLQYSRYNIHTTIFTLQYSHYNIDATVFTLQYLRYSIPATIFTYIYSSPFQYAIVSVSYHCRTKQCTSHCVTQVSHNVTTARNVSSDLQQHIRLK